MDGAPSKRNNPFANSGMVVQVELEDAVKEMKSSISNKQWATGNEKHPLVLMEFQKMVEQKCFNIGGGKFVAPAQRMVDFSNGKASASLPTCSYQPGLHSVQLNEVLPDFIYQSLAKGFIEIWQKKCPVILPMKQWWWLRKASTSSPVRIPRNNDTLTHPGIKKFIPPCGEGSRLCRRHCKVQLWMAKGSLFR